MNLIKLGESTGAQIASDADACAARVKIEHVLPSSPAYISLPASLPLRPHHPCTPPCCMFSNQLRSSHNRHRGNKHTCGDGLILCV
ncbi:hypothetical protein VTO73DRAFT_2229 [Trametes versicolor]